MICSYTATTIYLTKLGNSARSVANARSIEMRRERVSETRKRPPRRHDCDLIIIN